MASIPSSNQPTQATRTIKRFFVYLPIIVFAVILIVFSVANRDPVTLRLSPLPWIIETRLFALFFFGIFIGVVAAWLALIPGRWRIRRQAKAAGEKVHELAQEISDLRGELDRKESVSAPTPSDPE